MGSRTMQAAKVYRNLLKAVKKHIGDCSGKRHFRDYITAEFRKNVPECDMAAVENKIRLARDYAFLLNSVHHHKVNFYFIELKIYFLNRPSQVLNFWQKSCVCLNN